MSSKRKNKKAERKRVKYSSESESESEGMEWVEVDKKHKHEKRKKSKKSKRRKSTSESDSESGSPKYEWVEADAKKKKKHKKKKKSSKRRDTTSESESESDESSQTKQASVSQREDWMQDDSFVPTYQRDDCRRKNRRQQEVEEARMREKKILEARELNPYWKDKGSGLPSEASGSKESSKAKASTVGDGGYSWLKKAFQRVHEQAAKEGRSVEEVAAERWGSLKKLEGKLNEARENARALGISTSPPPGSSYQSQQWRKTNSSRDEQEPAHRRDYRNKHFHDKEARPSDYRFKEREREQYYKGRHDPREEQFSRHHKESFQNNRGSQEMARRDDDRRKSESLSGRFRMPRKSPEKEISQSRSSSTSYQPAWRKKIQEKEISNFRKESDAFPSTSATPSTSTYDANKPKLGSISSESGRLPSTTEVMNSSSAESCSDQEVEQNEEPKEEPILNKNEMNYLSGWLLRAKLLKETKFADKIRKHLVAAKESRKQFLEAGGSIREGLPRDDVIASKSDICPFSKSLQSKLLKSRNSNIKNVYVTPLQTKHYNEDRDSIKHMFEREKATTSEDQMKMYFAAASSNKETLTNDCDADVSNKTAAKMDNYSTQERDMQKFIHDYRKRDLALEKCCLCLDQPRLLRHTIIAKGNKVFLCVPPYKSLVEGHCFIVPINHTASTLLLDEDEYYELEVFKRGLMKMYRDQGKCLVFMETSLRHNSYPHAFVECIPMPQDTGEMAPLYFKKAIDESEFEWAQNKKLIDLFKKNVRKSVPRGLPFFSVEFGCEGGFAHVIEDEKRFPKYFGKEIVGGMLEIDSYDIVREKKEDWQQICRKVVKLVKLWEKYEEYFK